MAVINPEMSFLRMYGCGVVIIDLSPLRVVPL
jgi:hypothetical protein